MNKRFSSPYCTPNTMKVGVCYQQNYTDFFQHLLVWSLYNLSSKASLGYLYRAHDSFVLGPPMLPAFVDWMHGIQQTPFQRHAQLLSFFNCILESFWVPEIHFCVMRCGMHGIQHPFIAKTQPMLVYKNT
jgi:hypothetical protein